MSHRELRRCVLPLVLLATVIRISDFPAWYRPAFQEILPRRPGLERLLTPLLRRPTCWASVWVSIAVPA